MDLHLRRDDHGGGGDSGAGASAPAAGKRTRTQGLLSRREADGGAVSPGASEAVDRAAASSGAPLRDDLRGRFESSLGTDLSSVRVHTGDASAEGAAAVNAKAYAVGSDVHFGAGQYQPDDPYGMHLLAHEVAHTVQQGGSAPHRQDKLEVSSAGDSHEVEADRAADAMVRGQPFAVTPSGGGLSRAGVDHGAREDAKDYQKDRAARAAALPPPGAPVAKLAIHADTETADRAVLTKAELMDAKVGHAWISLQYNDPATVPDTIGSPTKSLLAGGGTAMGFWPLIRRASQWNADGTAKDQDVKDRMAAGQTPGAGASSNAAHTGFSMNPFVDVPGRVEEPDNAHSAKGSKSYDVTQAEVDSLLAYVDGKRGADYNLYSFNCTTFAVNAVTAAQKVPPSGAMFGLVALPNELYKDMLQMKVDGDKGVTTTPLAPGETETMPAPSKK